MSDRSIYSQYIPKVKKVQSGRNISRSRSRDLLKPYETTGDSCSQSEQTSSSQSPRDTQHISYIVKRELYEPKHFTYYLGQQIDGYMIYQFLNDGTFGRVVEVVDRNGNHYAMKIIKPVQRYIENAKIEVGMLEKINKLQNQIDDQNHIVKIKTAFKYGKYFCIIFEKLEMDLHDKLRSNNCKGFPLQEVKLYLKQILEALVFLHDQMKLIHTDLKPENIMLTKEGRLKLIDFGGATQDSDTCFHLINTRQYRAPEIILGCGRWSFPSDIWGLGCVVIELYNGKLLFPTRGDNFEHLRLIESQCGIIPEHMISQGSIKSFEWRTAQSRNTSDIVKTDNTDFTDLIQKMLIVDPSFRISASEALQHSFFQ